ncbi:MAG: c-type cytochrome [Bryobacteraceae bacterium]
MTGARVFSSGCAVGYCHGSGGSANRGPRLRGRNLDRSYIERVVHNGIPNSAMPGFKDRLKAEVLEAVVAYVASISSNTTATSASPPIAVAAPVAGTTPSVPERPSRLASLFFDPAREIRCGSCHELKDKGIKLAPLSATLPAKPGLVKHVTLRSGDSFPGLIVVRDDETVRVYDLSVPPPVLRSFDPDQVTSVEVETQWNHSLVTREYKPGEIAEILRLLSEAAP